MWYDRKQTDSKNIWEHAMRLHNKLEGFRTDARRYFKLTDFKDYTSATEAMFMKDNDSEDYYLENPYLTLNVTSSAVETLVNKISKAKPKVTFLTKEADREHRELAKKLDAFMLKTFKRTKAWQKSSRAFKSACVTGVGVLKVIIEKSKIKIKKTSVFNFFCDNAHIGDDEPTVAGEFKSVQLAKLIELFPAKKKELMDVHGQDMEARVKVAEIYKMYDIAFVVTEKLILHEDKWDNPLPYSLIKWEQADQGVLAAGVAKKINAMQNAITYIMGKTFTSIRNFAIPRVFVPKGAHPTVKDIHNIVGEIIEVNDTGKPITFSTPNATNPQVLQILEMLWQRAFEIIGISQLSAAGQIPRGLDKASGQALRSHQNIENERFATIRSDYEENFITLTKLILKLMPASMLPKGITEKNLKELKERANIWTSSLLPETVSGKLAMVGDLFNTGLLTGSQALSLMESPDTDKYIHSETSRLKAVDMLIDKAVDNGELPAYHPALGLDLYLDRAKKYFAELLIEDATDTKKIEIMTNFIADLEGKMAKQTGIANAINQVNGQPQQQDEMRIPGATPEVS